MSVISTTGATLETKQQEEEKSENERLMIFSDGVIAIALTVAAISIVKIPKDPSEFQVWSLSRSHFFVYPELCLCL